LKNVFVLNNFLFGKEEKKPVAYFRQNADILLISQKFLPLLDDVDWSNVAFGL
jgi:hypothetical protein